jgi:DNA-binding transcriptional MerR regulator
VADSPVSIPDRAFFKASEVCEIAGLQPYVLRSWELEFPGLGVTRKGTGSRIYRRADVEQVLEIRRLLFEEGLTLAGAKRRLSPDESRQPEPTPEELLDPAVRERLRTLKNGLRSLLEVLSGRSEGPSGSTRIESSETSSTEAEVPPVGSEQPRVRQRGRGKTGAERLPGV